MRRFLPSRVGRLRRGFAPGRRATGFDSRFEPLEDRRLLSVENHFAAASIAGATASVPAEIQGTKWNDVDGDGLRDIGEPGLQGWTIYLDQNNNGLREASEISTTTDAQGNYVFPGLSPGTYRVEEIQAPGWQQTYPPSTGLTGKVAVYNDSRFVDTYPAYFGESTSVQATLAMLGYTVQPFEGTTEAEFVAGVGDADLLLVPELDGNLFSAMQPGAIAFVQNFVSSGRGLIAHGWSQSGVEFLNGMFGFSLSRADVFTSTFARTTQAAGTEFQDDPATIPKNDSVIGLTPSSLPAGGVPIYLASQGSVAVALMHRGAGPITYLGWDWYNAKPLGSQDAGWVQVLNSAVLETPSRNGHHSVTVASGEAASGVDFGNINTAFSAQIKGTKWKDLDRDGTHDSGEPALAGWTIYIDADNDGTLDNGEMSTVTDAEGNYVFVGLAAGNYVVAELMQPRWEQTSPSVGLVNGGFESGDFSGWTQTNVGSGTVVINNGNFDPASPDGPLPPYEGGFSAVTNQTGVINQVLYQEVSIPPGAPATLEWADRIRNFASSFHDPEQEYRVEIRNTSDQVLATLFSTNPGDQKLTEWNTRSANLSAYTGQTVRIAFVERAVLNYFNVHVDNVRLTTTAAVNTRKVALAVGQIATAVDFGNVPERSPSLGMPDLLNAYDTGISSDDNITRLDNSAPAKRLEFEVSGTLPGATVTIYVDGAALGSAVASGTTTVVVTSGAFDLSDRTYTVTARQTEPGQSESVDSVSLAVTVDTTPPAPGVLDDTFGLDGTVLTTAIGVDHVVRDIAVQADGKIIAVGSAQNGDANVFVIARYNPDGTLDTSFDSDGVVSTSIGSLPVHVYAVAIQPSDGKIVVAGGAGSGPQFALARYNPDGSLDSTFGSGGITLTSMGFYGGSARDILLQPDGKIIAAGSGYDNATNHDFGLARYNADGTLDTSFSGDGKVTTSITGGRDRAQALALQADGRIVAVGIANESFSSASIAAVRYNHDGSLDTSFDGDGIVTTIVGTHGQANSVALQPDGKIVVGGHGLIGSAWDFILVRYKSDGSLDTGFDGDGKLTTNLLGSDFVYAIKLQPDGKIIAAGTADDNRSFAAARYNPNGSLDPSFSGDGKVTTRVSIGSGPEMLLASALDSEGLVVAGSANNAGKSVFALARYTLEADSAAGLQTASDTGISNSDNITSDDTPTFDVDAGPYFRLYRDGSQISGLYEAGASYTVPTQGDGTSAYTVTAVDAAGNESTPGSSLTITIDTTPPLVTIAAIAPQERTTAVSDILISFSKPIVGFDLSDLALTRGGGGNLLTSEQTLVSTDEGVIWTLGNLAPLTGSTGAYSLVLRHETSAIIDVAGNPLSGGDSVEFANVLGDMDGDDDLDNFDIQPFELALTDASAFISQYPDVVNYADRGDIDGDGDFDNFDIQPFEQLLTGGATAQAGETLRAAEVHLCVSVSEALGLRMDAPLGDEEILGLVLATPRSSWPLPDVGDSKSNAQTPLANAPTQRLLDASSLVSGLVGGYLFSEIQVNNVSLRSVSTSAAPDGGCDGPLEAAFADLDSDPVGDHLF